MRMLRLVHPLEISADVAKYDARVLAIHSDPFERIAIVLGYIARLARWNDVVRSIWTTFRRWNEMFFMQNRRIVPETGRFAAIGAYTMPIIEGTLPIGGSKGIRKSSNPSTPTVSVHAHSIFMFLARTVNCILNFIGIFLAINCAIFSLLFSVVFAIFVVVSLYAIRMALPPTLFDGIVYFRMVFTPLFYFVVSFYKVFIVMLLGLLPLAFTTLGIKTFCHLFLVSEKLSGSEIRALTFRAALKGIGDIQHSASLSPYLIQVSADGEISRRSGISLADISIISQETHLA